MPECVTVNNLFTELSTVTHFGTSAVSLLRRGGAAAARRRRGDDEDVDEEDDEDDEKEEDDGKEAVSFGPEPDCTAGSVT